MASINGARAGAFCQQGRKPALRKGGKFTLPPLSALPSTRASVLANATDDGATEALRLSVILATCALHPGLIAQFESALELLDHHHR